MCGICEEANSCEKETSKAAQRELQAEAKAAHRLNTNRLVALPPNKSAAFFLIPADWAESWRAYLRGGAPQPPPIDVSPLMCEHGLLRYGATHRAVQLVADAEWRYLSAKYSLVAQASPIRCTMRSETRARGESSMLTADSDATALEAFTKNYSPALCDACNQELREREECGMYHYASASIGVRKMTQKQYEMFASKVQARKSELRKRRPLLSPRHDGALAKRLAAELCLRRSAVPVLCCVAGSAGARIWIGAAARRQACILGSCRCGGARTALNIAPNTGRLA